MLINILNLCLMHILKLVQPILHAQLLILNSLSSEVNVLLLTITFNNSLTTDCFTSDKYSFFQAFFFFFWLHRNLLNSLFDLSADFGLNGNWSVDQNTA